MGSKQVIDGKGRKLTPVSINDLVDGSKDVDLKPYAKKADLNKKADKSELSKYATKEYVDSFIDEDELERKISEAIEDKIDESVLEDYAKKDDLAAYVKSDELGSKLTEYVNEHKDELKGEKGDTGATGAKGADGKDGKDGVDGKDGQDGKAFEYDDFTPEQLAELKGEKGDPGEPGKDGKDFEYKDFTPEQLAELKGEKGEQGEPGEPGKDGKAFEYKDFTPEQLAELKGEKGEPGEDGKDYILTEDDKAEIAGMVDLSDVMNQIEELQAEIEALKANTHDSASLKNALANDNLVILNDDIIVDDGAISISGDREVVLDLNGKSLEFENISGNNSAIQVVGANLTVKNGEIINHSGRAIAAFNGGSIEIGDGAYIDTTSGDCAVTATGAGSQIVMNGGEIKAQEAGILVTTGAAFEMNEGKITGVDNAPIMGNGSKNQGNVEIVMNGGELEGNITSNGYVACGVYMPNSGTFTMNGGKITSHNGAGVVARAGHTILNGGEIITEVDGQVVEPGKVGDSRVVVKCCPVVVDVESNYPGAKDGFDVTIGKDMVLTPAAEHDEIQLLPVGTEGYIIDNR